MTLTLNLPEELEQRLAQEARRLGVGADECAVRLLRSHLPLVDRNRELARLVRSWIDDGDEAEQSETFDILARTLDEDRSSDRKLFPTELRGVSW